MNTMTDLLEKAIAQISELPESSQDAFAAWLLAHLSSPSNDLYFPLNTSTFDFWNAPENDIWDSL
jgi:hypothetical protein